MANNDKFRAKFAKRIQKSKGKMYQFVNKLTIDIDRLLSEKSPVDTGRFKGNWVVGNGTINYSTSENTSSKPFEEYDKKNKYILNDIKINGQIIYITNALPYAKRLETGYSGQAPAGVVGITLAEINSAANKIGIALRSV